MLTHRSVVFVAPLALLVGVGVGCSTPVGDPEPTDQNELGLSLSVVSDSMVEGRLVTPHGAVAFRSEMVDEDVARVEFKRDALDLATTVDLTALHADVAYPEGQEITEEDRVVLRALATALDETIGNDTKVKDILMRNTNLWGAHPEGPLVTRQIVGDPERGWTTLCYGTSYRSFYYDVWFTTYKKYMQYGPNSYNCRARCGLGCTSWGTSAWTQDCGNHDVCEYYQSSANCMNEWDYAKDDFLYARNCSY